MQLKNEKTFLDFAHKLADASGQVLRCAFNKPLNVELKADASPVTLADREVEHTIRAMIEKQFPEHGIVGEEFGNIRPESTYQWVIDPIDGTKAFIAGQTTFTTLIALCERGIPLLGIIDQPIIGKRWAAIASDVAGHTPTSKPLAEVHISTTSASYFTPAQAAAYANLRKHCASESLGGDAFAYGLLTEGARDIVADGGMKPYDFCALAPVIVAAGGVITDWAGKPLTLHSDGTVLAAMSGELHAQVLELLKHK